MADASERAMSSSDHHEWASSVAGKIALGGDYLSKEMCTEWTANRLKKDDADRIVNAIRSAIDQRPFVAFLHRIKRDLGEIVPSIYQWPRRFMSNHRMRLNNTQATQKTPTILTNNTKLAP